MLVHINLKHSTISNMWPCVPVAMTIWRVIKMWKLIRPKTWSHNHPGVSFLMITSSPVATTHWPDHSHRYPSMNSGRTHPVHNLLAKLFNIYIKTITKLQIITFCLFKQEKIKHGLPPHHTFIWSNSQHLTTSICCTKINILFFLGSFRWIIPK